MMTTEQIENAVAAAEQKDKELWDALQAAEREAEAIIRAPRAAWHQQRQNVDLLRAMLEVIHALEVGTKGEPVCPACSIPPSANLNAQAA